jgi:hypothetical protein
MFSPQDKNKLTKEQRRHRPTRVQRGNCRTRDSSRGIFQPDVYVVDRESNRDTSCSFVGILVVPFRLPIHPCSWLLFLLVDWWIFVFEALTCHGFLLNVNVFSRCLSETWPAVFSALVWARSPKLKMSKELVVSKDTPSPAVTFPDFVANRYCAMLAKLEEYYILCLKQAVLHPVKYPVLHPVLHPI